MLLLDTNVLLFYLAAQVDLAMLGSYKRLSAFRTADLQPLRDLVEAFSAIITTPRVLTEVSNFIDQAPVPWRPQLIEALRTFVEKHEERFEASIGLAQRVEFKELALADTALLSLSKCAVIATLDGRLYQRVLASGGKAVNFDHVRGRTSKRRGDSELGRDA